MIYPAIDLINGRCVRLLHGDFEKVTQYDVDPRDVVKTYRDASARWIHIVDLDGAKDGAARQTRLISELAETDGVNIQTGGGVRRYEDVTSLLEAGVSRVVIGSLAVTERETVKLWLRDLGGDAICLAIDVKFQNGTPYPAIKGWTETTPDTLWDVLDDYQGTGAKYLLVTDIGVDGTLEGPNTDLYEQILDRYPDYRLIASGGVGNLDHVRKLKTLPLEGIITGKALYEGKFTCEEAVQC